MVDVPDGGLEDISEVIIYGVESEQIEEENDAYNDLRAELGTRSFYHKNCIIDAEGIHQEAEDDLAELMPSCFLINMFDCLFMNISSFCKRKTRPGVEHV